MKKSFVWASIILIGLLTGTKTEASARRFYLELLGAIDHAQAKARLFLDAGTWRSTVGDTEIKWIVKKATAAVTSLNYESGLLQNGQIIFEDPITAVLKRTVNGQVYCVVLTIKQIDYSDQGYIEPSSKLGEQPSSPDCNARAGRAELQRVASISDDIQEVFSGRVFRGMGKLGKTERCVDVNCANTKPDTGPINRVQLLGTTNIVTLLGDRDINFPSGGKITTDSGSRLKIARFDYDVPAEGVDGEIEDATLNISAGQLKAGTTEMTFSGGSSIKNSGIKFVKANGAAVISGGRLEVILGSNTIINLFAHPLYPSQITLDRAKATFSDLRISFSGASPEVGARYANLSDIQVKGAIVAFSESNSLSIGPTQFGVLLGCDEGQSAGDECLGFSWSDGKPNVVGRISGLNASLRSGTFALSDGGVANLEPGGTVQADTLYIDTRKPNNPIRGRFTAFMADISGQGIAIDKDTKIHAAKIHLQSNNLTFGVGDKYPTGDLSFDGSLTGAANGTFGNIPLAQASISFQARREPKGQVAIANGKVRGTVTMRDGPASGTLAVALDSVVFSAGYGSADISLAVTNASYTVHNPRNYRPGDNVDVDLKEINIPLSLLDPIQITNQHVVIEAGRWKLPEIARSFRLGFSLRNEELLYVRTHVDLGIVEPKCVMKVKYLEASYEITGQLRLNLGGGDKGLLIDSMNLNNGIALDPNLGSCDDVIDVVCGLAGNALLGPIGTVAAAMICQRKIDKLVGELTQKFSDLTKERVRALRFRASF